jgi:UDP-GlcNAc3NAcA epimerase
MENSSNKCNIRIMIILTYLVLLTQSQVFMLKVVTIVGARPQFVKAATISRIIAKRSDIEEIIVHTGQHFDKNMSEVFFTEMEIPEPKYNLNINSLNHGAMTGRMLEAIEAVLLTEKPDWLLVYGDTNSTLAGALAAKKLHIKVAHIEAGLRSFNNKMPEEINRILTDRISDILFCPTQYAVSNLKNEGYENIETSIKLVGDVMYDAAVFHQAKMRKPKIALPRNFVLATVHRAENTDNRTKLTNIISGLNAINETTPVILPIHPRTKKVLNSLSIKPEFKLIEPLGYLEIVYLLDHCDAVLTDSGGMQKEAYFFKKPCLTLRDQTEWVELIDEGVNRLVDTAANGSIPRAYQEIMIADLDFTNSLYGDAHSAEKIVSIIIENSSN